MNKKQIVSGFFIAFVASFVSFSAPAAAAAATLPPGNPFYFMQDGMRVLRRSFTFNQVSKALLEVRLVGERQADIIEVMAAGKDESVVRDAFTLYANEVRLLTAAAKGITDDRVTSAVFNTIVTHSRFFGAIVPGDAVSFNVVVAAQDALRRLAVGVFGDAPTGAFRSRVAAALIVSDGEYSEIAAAETLTGIQFVAEKLGNVAFAREARFAKDDLIVSFIGKMKGGGASLSVASQAPGDAVARLYVLEEMRARVGDVATKTAIALAERPVLSSLVSRNMLGASLAHEAILRVMSIMGTKPGDEVAYFLDQANMFLMNNVYDLSFQNAVAAYVSAGNASLETSATVADLHAEIAGLKRRYDALRGIRPAFIEKRITIIADMAGKARNRETLAAIREMKLVLAIVGQ